MWFLLKREMSHVTLTTTFLVPYQSLVSLLFFLNFAADLTSRKRGKFRNLHVWFVETRKFDLFSNPLKYLYTSNYIN